MINSTEEDFPLLVIYYALSMSSVAMCAMAIVYMIYYKFYCSFNYRLVLYLLISFLLNTLMVMIANTLEIFLDPESTPPILDSLFWYPTWTIQLCIGFMTVVIFFMVLFSVELRKAEIPSTIACFALPLVELVGIKFHEQTMQFSRYNAVVGIAVAGICTIAMATTLIYVVYMYYWLRRHAISNNNEEQHLLHAEPPRQRSQNTQKEILPMILYPATFLIWLFVYYLLIYNIHLDPTTHSLEAYNVMDASAGLLSSIAFFVHVIINQQRRKNALGSESHNTASSHGLRETDEGQIITVAEGVTATHVTHFDPLGDSDVEP